MTVSHPALLVADQVTAGLRVRLKDPDPADGATIAEFEESVAAP
jgi:hypothetical protein